MPIIGEDPVLVLGQDAPIDNELSKLARAVRSFQETLGSRAQEHVVSSITSRDEEDNANAAAAAAYWTATKAEFDTIHARRVQDIDDLTKTFSKQISELLGTSGITAATPQSVFGDNEDPARTDSIAEALADLQEADAAMDNSFLAFNDEQNKAQEELQTEYGSSLDVSIILFGELLGEKQQRVVE